LVSYCMVRACSLGLVLAIAQLTPSSLISCLRCFAWPVFGLVHGNMLSLHDIVTVLRSLVEVVERGGWMLSLPVSRPR
jgi:hypothetical protein